MRTGAIGLNAFLFKIRVPGVNSPRCERGCGEETTLYVVLRYEEWEEERRSLEIGELVMDGHSMRAALGR